MAKSKKTKSSKKGAIKKKWIPILAPRIFNGQQIGETHVVEARAGIGKDMKVNLMTLTKNPKNQGINVYFNANGQHDGCLTTIFTGYRIMPSVVRRFVRRGKDKIEDSFICVTADGKRVRMKPLMITRTKARGSTKTALTIELRKYIAIKTSKTPYDKLVEEIVTTKLQKSINATLSKIFPIAKCEIRWFKLLSKTEPSFEVKKTEIKTETVSEVKKIEEKPKQDANTEN